MTAGYHVIVEFDDNTPSDAAIAGDVGLILTDAYPGHPWHVNVSSKQGILHIKHMRMSNKWGIVRKLGNVLPDAKVFKHEVVMAAGELLERAGMRVGKDVQESIVGIDGIPLKDRVLN